VVLGISTDNLPTLSHWAKTELHLSYPLASDFQRKVAEQYGVLMKDNGMANRATFVIDAEGKIEHIEEGSSAIDPDGAATACSRVKKK
jgi:peroxiredoxin